MKGQDVMLMFKLIFWNDGRWTMSSLGESLELSKSQIHYSIGRCVEVGLLSEKSMTPKVDVMLEFVEHALKFLFPPKWDGEGHGLLTTFSVEPLSDELSISGSPVVWRDQGVNSAKGKVLIPIHGNVPSISKRDRQFYESFALLDAFRSGRAREKKLALGHLTSRLESRRAKFE
jgi:hypothetical protein